MVNSFHLLATVEIESTSINYVFSICTGTYGTVPYRTLSRRIFFMESSSSGTFYLHTCISTILFYRWIKISTKRQICIILARNDSLALSFVSAQSFFIFFLPVWYVRIVPGTDIPIFYFFENIEHGYFEEIQKYETFFMYVDRA